MFRTAAAILSVAFLATAAHAADVKVSTLGLTPVQVRVAVSDAALKACNEALADEALAIYEREPCVRDAVADALAKSNTSSTASLTAPVSAQARTRVSFVTR